MIVPFLFDKAWLLKTRLISENPLYSIIFSSIIYKEVSPHHEVFQISLRLVFRKWNIWMWSYYFVSYVNVITMLGENVYLSIMNVNVGALHRYIKSIKWNKNQLIYQIWYSIKTYIQHISSTCSVSCRWRSVCNSIRPCI